MLWTSVELKPRSKNHPLFVFHAFQLQLHYLETGNTRSLHSWTADLANPEISCCWNSWIIIHFHLYHIWYMFFHSVLKTCRKLGNRHVPTSCLATRKKLRLENWKKVCSFLMSGRYLRLHTAWKANIPLLHLRSTPPGSLRHVATCHSANEITVFLPFGITFLFSFFSESNSSNWNTFFLSQTAKCSFSHLRIGTGRCWS